MKEIRILLALACAACMGTSKAASSEPTIDPESGIVQMTKPWYEELKTTIDIGFHSKYIAPGFGSIISDEPNFQTSLTVASIQEWGKVYACVYNYSTFNGEWDSGDETDLVFGATYKLTEMFELRGSVAQFLLADRKDVYRGTFGVWSTLGGWDIGANALCFYSHASSGDRWVGHLSAGRQFEFVDENYLSLQATLVWDGSNQVSHESLLARLDARYDHQFGDHFTVTPIGVTYWWPLAGDRRDARECDVDVFTGIKLSF